MKAISIRQPWASMIAEGRKEYETRSWATPYRGQIAIHAAKTLTVKEWEHWQKMPFYREFLEQYYSMFASLPRGCIIAVGELAAIYDAVKLAPKISESEVAFGNFAPGRYAWRIVNVKKLDSPIPLRGQLGLFDVVQSMQTQYLVDSLLPRIP